MFSLLTIFLATRFKFESVGNLTHYAPCAKFTSVNLLKKLLLVQGGSFDQESHPTNG
jgi:hypothetical protein